MKKIGFVLLIAVCFSLVGCTNTDLTVKPNDFRRDYWIGDIIDIDKIDESRIYEKSEERIVYLDSNYSFEDNADDSPILPKERVIYYFDLRENNWSVSYIYITDPCVKVCGLTMNSDKRKIQKTFKNLGFDYLDRYSGFDPCYSKDNIQIRIYAYYISIEFSVPNLL